jgi:DDHD domain
LAEKPLRPCEEALATQLENGYQKIRPWKFNSSDASETGSAADGKETTFTTIELDESEKEADEQPEAKGPQNGTTSSIPDPVKRTLQLSGIWKDNAVTFEDKDSAYIAAGDFYSRFSSTLYQRFSGGGHFAGIKVVRGYSEIEQKADAPKTEDDNKVASPTIIDPSSAPELQEQESTPESPHQETIRQRLERQVSSLIASYSPETEEEETRRRNEEEIRNDYNEDDQSQQGREIEHLVLVTHGIGQRLGMRLDGASFIHDVNTLRKTIKSVYGDSQDLQALNGDVETPVKNSRVQVLPIVWRHMLDFPRHVIKHTKQEHGLEQDEGPKDDEYPSLEQITLPGVPAVRNLITDLGLDILLYLSPAYRPHITKILLEECNRIYTLFRARNPSFNGKVSVIGHSLGSAVMFDLLCSQKSDSVQSGGFLGFRSYQQPQYFPELQLHFDVEDFYSVGSPVGLLQMLKGRVIAARQTPNVRPAQTPYGVQGNPFADDYFEILTSAPKCKQLFNIFHPNDPVAYRLEPLISPAMSKLAPQPLPYVKKSIFSNLPSAPSGISAISSRVSQSVQGMWNSFSSGLAHTLINRSLGIVGDDGRMENPLPLSLRLTMPVTPGQMSSEAEAATAAALAQVQAQAPMSDILSADEAKRLVVEEAGELVHGGGDENQNPPTLLSTGLETLFSGFKNAQPTLVEKPRSAEAIQAENDEKERLRGEDQKVRALNKNGRVDYSIQEYVDFAVIVSANIIAEEPLKSLFSPVLRVIYRIGVTRMSVTLLFLNYCLDSVS